MELVNGRYSKSEKVLFSLLPSDGTKISTEDLVKMRRKKRRWPIDHPQNSVSATMRTIQKKGRRGLEAEENGKMVKVKVMQTRQRGPYPVEYWIERL